MLEPVSPRLRPRVLVVGLDGLVPNLVFDRWRNDLPTFRRLMNDGAWGKLRSVDPPVTVPAWACMTTGCTPSQLGVYGFRCRPLGSYDQRYFATSDQVRQPRVWELLAAAGFRSGLLGIPQTWPPTPVQGWLVTDFLTPSTSSPFTHPACLAAQILAAHPDYRFDVDEYRTANHERLVHEVREVAELHCKVFRELAATHGGDFLMMVEMGPDRMHHAFFRHCDPFHPRHDPVHPLVHTVLDHYRLLDRFLDQLLQDAGDDCTVLVVSDHGARSLRGGFRINQWLIDLGYLVLRQPLRRPRAFDESLVDFSKTRAWAWGGHYARVFVNLNGREPQGQVPKEDYEAFLARLTQELEAALLPGGAPAHHRVLRPQPPPGALSPAGDWPDLLVYPGDLDLRAVGTVGGAGWFVEGNDTGPDDANHDPDGVFIGWDPSGKLGHGERSGLSILDVTPTILDLFGVAIPEGLAGRSMCENEVPAAGVSSCYHAGVR